MNSHIEDSLFDAIDAARKHAQLARGVVATGARLLKEANDTKDLDRYIKATAAIEKGSKMERDANDKITELMRRIPPERIAERDGSKGASPQDRPEES